MIYLLNVNNEFDGTILLLYAIIGIFIFCILVAIAGAVLGWGDHKKRVAEQTDLLRKILEKLPANKEGTQEDN